MKQQGFTLVELMIVVLIIGILATIATPAYMSYAAKAEASEAFTITESIKTQMMEYVSQNGQCPASGTNGFPDVSSLIGKYVAKVTVGGQYPSNGVGSACSVTVTFKKTHLASGLKGGTVKQTVDLQNGQAVSWQCSSTNIDSRYLPLICG